MLSYDSFIVLENVQILHILALEQINKEDYDS